MLSFAGSEGRLEGIRESRKGISMARQAVTGHLLIKTHFQTFHGGCFEFQRGKKETEPISLPARGPACNFRLYKEDALEKLPDWEHRTSILSET
jgi:hypothetical protein